MKLRGIYNKEKIMNISKQEKDRIRGLHKSGSIIKEQVEMVDGMPMLDPNQDMQSQLKQIMDKTNEKVLADIMVVIELASREDMSVHELLDRMGVIANKLQNNEYLTI